MQKSTKDWKNIGTRMPIRNDNIDLLLLVAGEYATNDEEHFESYLFINGTTLYTNDSYFDTNGWIDPGTCYQKLNSDTSNSMIHTLFSKFCFSQ